MRYRRAVAALVAGPLLLTTGACSIGLEQHRDDAVQAIEEMGERGRFCLSLTRAVTAIESASPGTAQDAIEEAVTQAPDGLLDDVRDLADEIRAAQSRGADGLRDPGVQEAADALLDRTRDLCEPL